MKKFKLIKLYPTCSEPIGTIYIVNLKGNVKIEYPKGTVAEKQNRQYYISPDFLSYWSEFYQEI